MSLREFREQNNINAPIKNKANSLREFRENNPIDNEITKQDEISVLDVALETGKQFGTRAAKSYLDFSKGLGDTGALISDKITKVKENIPLEIRQKAKPVAYALSPAIASSIDNSEASANFHKKNAEFWQNQSDKIQIDKEYSGLEGLSGGWKKAVPTIAGEIGGQATNLLMALGGGAAGGLAAKGLGVGKVATAGLVTTGTAIPNLTQEGNYLDKIKAFEKIHGRKPTQDELGLIQNVALGEKVINATAETVADKFLFGKIFPNSVPKGIKAKTIKALKDVGQQAFTEGLTETAQETISIGAENILGIADNSQNAHRLIESGVIGGLTGGILGGAGSLASQPYNENFKQNEKVNNYIANVYGKVLDGGKELYNSAVTGMKNIISEPSAFDKMKELRADYTSQTIKPEEAQISAINNSLNLYNNLQNIQYTGEYNGQTLDESQLKAVKRQLYKIEDNLINQKDFINQNIQSLDVNTLAQIQSNIEGRFKPKEQTEQEIRDGYNVYGVPAELASPKAQRLLSTRQGQDQQTILEQADAYNKRGLQNFRRKIDRLNKEKLENELGLNSPEDYNILEPEYNKEKENIALNIVARATNKSPQYIKMTALGNSNNKNFQTRKDNLETSLENTDDRLAEVDELGANQYYDTNGTGYENMELGRGSELANQAYQDLINRDFYNQLTPEEQMHNAYAKAEIEYKDLLRNVLVHPKGYKTRITQAFRKIEKIAENLPAEAQEDFYNKWFEDVEKIDDYIKNKKTFDYREGSPKARFVMKKDNSFSDKNNPIEKIQDILFDKPRTQGTVKDVINALGPRAQGIMDYFVGLEDIKIANSSRKLGSDNNKNAYYDISNKSIHLNLNSINAANKKKMLHSFFHELTHAKQHLLTQKYKQLLEENRKGLKIIPEKRKTEMLEHINKYEYLIFVNQDLYEYSEKYKKELNFLKKYKKVNGREKFKELLSNDKKLNRIYKGHFRRYNDYLKSEFEIDADKTASEIINTLFKENKNGYNDAFNLLETKDTTRMGSRIYRRGDESRGSIRESREGTRGISVDSERNSGFVRNGRGRISNQLGEAVKDYESNGQADYDIDRVKLKNLSQIKREAKKEFIKEEQKKIESAKDYVPQIENAIRRQVRNISLKVYEVDKNIHELVEASKLFAKKYKTKDKTIREIMPFLREKTDFPIELQNDRPDLYKLWVEISQEDKENLSNLADEMSERFKIYWEDYKTIAKDYESKQDKENYISHIWDIDNKKHLALTTNYFATRSKFAKHRVIESLYEGIQGIELDNGEILKLKPKTLDYAELLKIHSDNLIKVYENKQLSDFIKHIKNKNGIPLVAYGKDAPVDWVQMSHPALTRKLPITEESNRGEVISPELQNILAEIGVGVGRRINPTAFGHPVRKLGHYLSSPYSKEIALQRWFSNKTLTHEIGHALDEALNLGESFFRRHENELYEINEERINAYMEAGDRKGTDYAESAEEQIAEFFALFFNDPKQCTVIAPNATAEIIDRMTKSEKFAKLLPDNFDWSKAKNILEEKNVKFQEQAIHVHPDLVEPLLSVFDAQKPDNDIWKAYDKLNGLYKTNQLSLSGFHVLALSESALGNVGFIDTIKLFNPFRIHKAFKVNDFGVYSNDKLVRDALAHGLQIGTPSDLTRSDVNKFIDGIVEKIEKQNIIKPLKKSSFVVKGYNAILEFNNKFLWDYLHNQYKMLGYKNLCEQQEKRLKRKLKTEEKEEIAQWVNDSFGGQLWELLGIRGSHRKIATRTMLSADWNISCLRQALGVLSTQKGQEVLNEKAKTSDFWYAVREWTRKAGITSLNRKSNETGIRGDLARKFWIRSFVMYAIYANLINAICRFWDKEEHPEYYPEKMKFLDYFMFTNAEGHKTHPFIGRYKTGQEKHIRLGKQFRELPEFLEKPIEKTGSKGSPALQLGAVAFTGNSLSGFENKNLKDKEGLERLGAIVEEFISSMIPFSVKNALDPTKEFTITDLFAPSSKGVSFYTAKEQYKKAILQNDKEKINEVTKTLIRNNIDPESVIKISRAEITQEENKEIRKKIENEEIFEKDKRTEKIEKKLKKAEFKRKRQRENINSTQEKVLKQAFKRKAG